MLQTNITSMLTSRNRISFSQRKCPMQITFTVTSVLLNRLFIVVPAVEEWRFEDCEEEITVYFNIKTKTLVRIASSRPGFAPHTSYTFPQYCSMLLLIQKIKKWGNRRQNNLDTKLRNDQSSSSRVETVRSTVRSVILPRTFACE